MRLTEKQRASILAGKHPKIELAVEADCPEGQMVLQSFGRTPIVTLIWTGPVKAHGVYFASYRVLDLRPERLLRSTPPATRFRRSQDAPTPDALERAAEESAYTRNPVQAMSQEPEAVPKSYQDRLSQEARVRNVFSQAERQARAEIIHLERRLLDARKRGRVGQAKVLETRIRRSVLASGQDSATGS